MKRHLLLLLVFAGISSTLPAQFAQKNVVMEEFTGAWCGWCPDGAVILENIENNFTTRVNPVSIHSGDAMEIPDGNEIATYYTSSYPSGTIDRTSMAVGRTSWQGQVNSRISSFASVGVSIQELVYDPITRAVNFKVRAEFLAPFNDELRFNAYIIEDEVSGTGTGWDQVNYLNTQSGHFYFGAGDPIVGFVHNHVLRNSLGGAWGVASSISSPVAYGDTAVYAFSTTLPANYDISKIHIVAFVSKYGPNVQDREILNSSDAKIELATGLNEENLFADLSLSTFPNPANSRVSLAFNLMETEEMDLSIYDLQGRKVKTILSGLMSRGMHTTDWTDCAEFPGGIYHAVLSVNGRRIVQRIALQH